MAAITREELILLLEGVIRDAPTGHLRLDSTARWQADHDEFCRRLCARLIEAMATEGFAWARIPKHGDELYRMLIGATNEISGLSRAGLVSESASSRELARHDLANTIMKFLRHTQTTVVRRRPG